MKLFHLSVFVSDIYTKTKKSKKTKKQSYSVITLLREQPMLIFRTRRVSEKKQINMMLTKLFCIFSNMFIIGSSLSCQLQTSTLLSPTLTH